MVFVRFVLFDQFLPADFVSGQDIGFLILSFLSASLFVVYSSVESFVIQSHRFLDSNLLPFVCHVSDQIAAFSQVRLVTTLFDEVVEGHIQLRGLYIHDVTLEVLFYNYVPVFDRQYDFRVLSSNSYAIRSAIPVSFRQFDQADFKDALNFLYFINLVYDNDGYMKVSASCCVIKQVEFLYLCHVS